MSFLLAELDRKALNLGSEMTGDETRRTNASFVQLLKQDEFDSQIQHSYKTAKLWCTNSEPWTVQMLSLSHMFLELNGFLKLL